MDGSFSDHDERDEQDEVERSVRDDATGDDHVQRTRTLDVMRRIGVSVEELWIHYLSMGGDVDKYEVDAYFHGLMRLPAIDRDMLSQSVNELLDDIKYGPRAPFSTDDVDSQRPMDTGGGDSATDDPDAGAPLWVKNASQLISIVYSSVATRPLDEPDLLELLGSSRQTNGASGVTGLLLYREERFLQVLEGPELVVRDLMRSITVDSRHTDMRVLLDEQRQHRRFPNWTMGFELVRDSLADKIPGFERTFIDTQQDDDPAWTIRSAKELLQWFQDHAKWL